MIERKLHVFMCLKSSQIVCKKESAIHHRAVFEFSKEQIYGFSPRRVLPEKLDGDVRPASLSVIT